MTPKELIEAIRSLTALKQVTLGEIEKALQMPENCLSGMLTGSRKLSDKWRPLLEAYVKAKMNGATEIIISIGEAKPTSPVVEKETKKESSQIVKAVKISASKSPPPGMSKSQQIRWHRENNQTLL